MVNDFQNGSLSSRLGNPMIYGIDAVHGHNNVYKATVFPHNVALGATRDPDLVKRIGAATALEVRAMGSIMFLLPALRYVAEIPDGVGVESYSEDPSVLNKDRYHSWLARRSSCDSTRCSMLRHKHKNYRTKDAEKKHSPKDWSDGAIRPHCHCDIMRDYSIGSLLSGGGSVPMPQAQRRNGLTWDPDLVKRMAQLLLLKLEPLGSIMFLLPALRFAEIPDGGFVISDWQGIDRITDPPHANFTYSVLSGVNAGMTWILRVKFTMGLFENPVADQSFVPSWKPRTTILNGITAAVELGTEVVYSEDPDMDYVKSENFSTPLSWWRASLCGDTR
ncbi:uncharacterized protein LOC116145804 [Pistacia vera]|uniref:uncharacterized protein LOC116145804 n=1 Tax=Pistacia vera TaxID=55513 RepID=UPI001262DA7F|nr:uncharacterized protein LOC116145804 [Pistacia vera]